VSVGLEDLTELNLQMALGNDDVVEYQEVLDVGLLLFFFGLFLEFVEEEFKNPVLEVLFLEELHALPLLLHLDELLVPMGDHRDHCDAALRGVSQGFDCGGNCVTFARELRAKHQTCPILILSVFVIEKNAIFHISNGSEFAHSLLEFLGSRILSIGEEACLFEILAEVEVVVEKHIRPNSALVVQPFVLVILRCPLVFVVLEDERRMWTQEADQGLQEIEIAASAFMAWVVVEVDCFSVVLIDDRDGEVAGVGE